MNLASFVNGNIDAILSTTGVTEPPYVPVREGANLDKFAVVSENDVSKLVMKQPADLLTPCQPNWLNSTLLNYSHSLLTQLTSL